MTDILEYIEKFDLKRKCRLRHYVYKRSYLYNALREQGFGYAEIGKLFDKDHATVIHGVKTHKDLMSTNDQLYLECVEDLVLMFEQVTEEFDLIEDIMTCFCLKKLKKIKYRISHNMYKGIPLQAHIV